MKLITLISTALLLPTGLMLSVSAQAHIGGHKLDEAQCSAVWAKASPGGKAEAISVDQAQPYVVNVGALDEDGDGSVTLEDFKLACADGLMSDQAVTESEECSDVHFTQMNNMIAMMTDATKKKVAMTHLELSKAAMKKGDAVECMIEMIEAHKAMGL
jgi:hypothetical protein